MITRHHIALTILCALILCSALVPSDLVLMTVICTGACIGAILPDIQMKKPKGIHIRTVAWLVSRFTGIVFTPLLCRLYQALGERTCNPEDKRLTHSVPGILLLGAALATIVLVPAIIISSTAPYLSAAFLCGVMLGLVLHLAGDMCTRKGITPLFPFSTTMISGSIRPCDTTDRRIAQFHFYHCTVAGIILGFQYLESWQGIASVPLCLFGLCSCLGMMIWSSDVSLSYDALGELADNKYVPAISDPFVIQWKIDHLSPELLMGVYFFSKNEQ